MYMYIIFTCTGTCTYFDFSGSAFAALFASFPVAWEQPHLGQMTRGREGEEVLAAEGTDGVGTKDDDDDDNDDGGYISDGGRVG
jgi:hypothetical protein